MATMSEHISALNNISRSMDVINLGDTSSVSLNVLWKVIQSSSCSCVRTGVDSRHRKSIPAHIRRHESYNFYNPLRNIENSSSLDRENIRTWCDWRQRVNVHMAATIVDETISNSNRVADINTHHPENEIVLNVYKTTKFSDCATSVLGVKAFTLFGIPRVKISKERVDCHDDGDLIIDDLVVLPPPDYPTDSDSYCDELPPDYYADC